MHIDSENDDRLAVHVPGAVLQFYNFGGAVLKNYPLDLGGSPDLFSGEPSLCFVSFLQQEYLLGCSVNLCRCR